MASRTAGLYRLSWWHFLGIAATNRVSDILKSHWARRSMTVFFVFIVPPRVIYPAGLERLTIATMCERKDTKSRETREISGFDIISVAAIPNLYKKNLVRCLKNNLVRTDSKPFLPVDTSWWSMSLLCSLPVFSFSSLPIENMRLLNPHFSLFTPLCKIRLLPFQYLPFQPLSQALHRLLLWTLSLRHIMRSVANFKNFKCASSLHKCQC